jgi:hypothetical protein
VSKKTLASKTKLLKTGIHLLHFEELPLSNVQIQIIMERFTIRPAEYFNAGCLLKHNLNGPTQK